MVPPAALVLIRSFTGADGGASLGNYAATFADPDFLTSIANSLTVSCASALVATGLAFLLSYTVNCTNVPAPLKRAIGLLAQLPMLLPTITYGFAIIYTFGRQGLLTRALGFQAFDIYGFNGLLMGYVIYTLPTAFLLTDNSFRFIDKRYLIVSCVMGNSPAQIFARTIVRPLAGARRRGRRRSRRQPGRKGRRGGKRGLRGRPGDHLLQRRPRGPGRLPDRAG